MKTVDLNNTVDQKDLTNIYRTFCSITVAYTLSQIHMDHFQGEIDHMLCQKIHLSKLKMIEIIPSIFPDHNRMKLEINNKKKKLESSRIH